MKLIYMLLLCGILSVQLFSQAPVRVRVSNDDPRWGETIKVSYDPPLKSVYAQEDFHDTLYCAALIYTSWGERNSVQPMHRASNSTVYQSDLRIPDSTTLIRIEIAVPTDRAPDGILMFTPHMPKAALPPGEQFGACASVDSALNIELHDYPTHYDAYTTAFNTLMAQSQKLSEADAEKLRRTTADRYLKELYAIKKHNLSWLLTVYRLESAVSKNESTVFDEYQAEIRTLEPDELAYSFSYWNSFFAPSMVNGEFRMQYERARAVTPLIERFPRSAMAKMWLQRIAYDTAFDAKAYKRVMQYWLSSQDVDLLSAFASALSNQKSLLYDPAEALNWITRAEKSWQQYSGFLSGENIFGSMGRYGRLMQSKVLILGEMHRMEEAKNTAHSALRGTKEAAKKTDILMSLAQAYRLNANDEQAERNLGAALSMTSQRHYTEIDSIYLRRRHESETRDAYVLRIAKQYASEDELPALGDFEYTTTSGHKGKLSDTRGKLVVLDFWFIGCAGCELEHKSLDAFAKRMKSDSSVVLLSVALNDAKTLKHYLKTDSPDFPVVASGQAICDALNITGYPTHVILDRSGKTVMWEMGGSATTGEALEQRLKELR